MNRRRFLQSSAGLIGSGLGLGLYTWRWEPHWVEFVERRLPLANLPNRWVGARLVQLSDLHIGPRVDDAYLIETFAAVKRLTPEMVVYTGDFTSHSPDVFTHAERIFAHLPLGRHGTFGILGNHDYGPHWSKPEVAGRIATAAEAAGVRVLRNESVDVGGLQIVGLDDLWARHFDLIRGLGKVRADNAALVLSHNPDTVDETNWGRYAGWILCGHTHGGQCKPPFLPPPLVPVKNRNYVAGEYALAGGRTMYINRGLGHLLRVRCNARPEVTIFRLEQA